MSHNHRSFYSNQRVRLLRTVETPPGFEVQPACCLVIGKRSPCLLPGGFKFVCTATGERMRILTGNERYRCTSVTQGGFGRSLSTEITILELEEVDEDTKEVSWRYATYEDLK